MYAVSEAHRERGLIELIRISLGPQPLGVELPLEAATERLLCGDQTVEKADQLFHRAIKWCLMVGTLNRRRYRNLNSGAANVYAYAGDEYTARYGFASPTGGPAGYGSSLVSYSKCTNEVALNTCSGANRNIYEGTVGYWYRIHSGNWGRFEYGNQVAYLHRSLWSGIGPTPEGRDLVVYSTLRIFLP